jgi:hypothetical protein
MPKNTTKDATESSASLIEFVMVFFNIRLC